MTMEGEMSSVALENLYPALTQCFAVIICGYVAGRTGVVTEAQSSGLNTFVGTFSLPSLIFLSLASLNLSDVNWYFLAAVFVSKAVVFVSVMLVTLLVSRPMSPSRAGLYAIFCTQSNDFAIGYPIVVALYKKLHPDFVSYLYLLAPVSLVILNPFGFVLMEVSRNNESDQPPSKWTTVANIARNIATNPIVFMTTLGMVANILFHHSLPTLVEEILNVFGSAFTGTALFLLGLRMVGKVQKLQGFALLVPGILIAVKLLALPLVTREVVSLVLQFSQHNNTVVQDLSTYGFLYGTFPSAPGVFVYATRYALDVDLIACAMVACTFLSAPLMFASAKMVIASNLDPEQFMKTLNLFEFDISIVASLSAIWMLVVFVVNKSYHNIHLRMVMCLAISQLVGCLGFLIGHIPLPWAYYTHVALETVGDLSARLWTALLAMSLLQLVGCLGFLIGHIPLPWAYYTHVALETVGDLSARLWTALSLLQLVGCLGFLIGHIPLPWAYYTHVALETVGDLSARLWTALSLLQLVGCLGFLIGHIPLPWAYYTHVALETVGDLSARLWTALLAMSLLQLVGCLGFLIGHIPLPWAYYTHVALETVGDLSARLWTALLAMSLLQLVGCLGFLIGHIPLPWAYYTHVALETVGDLSARLWTALLAMALLLVQCKNPSILLRLQPVFFIIAWGLPAVAVAVMMASGTPQPHTSGQDYEFGRAQAAIVLFVLITSLIVTVGCLVLHQWYLRRQKQYLLLVRETNETIAQAQAQATNGGPHSAVPRRTTSKSEDRVSINSARPSVDGSLGPERQTSEERQLDAHEDSLLRLIVLLVFLVCSLFISLSVCVWRVVMEGITGVYVEMLFLDTSLNRGQSLLVLAVYGLDSSTIFEPIFSSVSRLWYGGEPLLLPSWESLTFETRHVCEQFISHHLDQCRQHVCTETRWRLWRYRPVFSGQALVDWLVQHAVAADRAQATEYCNHLVWGRVISHLHGVEPFHDKPDCWYTFADDN